MSLKALQKIRTTYYTENLRLALRVEGKFDIVRRIDTTRRLFCVLDIEANEWYFPEDGTGMLITIRNLIKYYKLTIKGPSLAIINDGMPWK